MRERGGEGGWVSGRGGGVTMASAGEEARDGDGRRKVIR